MILISLDIDGTLERGDPPGPVTFEFACRAAAAGALVGSSSDRALTDQREFWLAGAVRVDFTVLKQQLLELPGRYPGCRYLHIGDSMMDEYYAGLGGFEFWNARALARRAAELGLTPAVVTEYLLREVAELGRENRRSPGDRRFSPLTRTRGEVNHSILSKLSTVKPVHGGWDGKTR